MASSEKATMQAKRWKSILLATALAKRVATAKVAGEIE
jgi:hypothetical protein